MSSELEHRTSDAVLAHFGKKGMKWGVRQAYGDRMSRRANTLQRTSEGKSTVVERARTSTLGTTKKTAAALSPRIEHHAERVRNGQLKTKDILYASQNLRYKDLVRGVGRRNG